MSILSTIAKIGLIGAAPFTGGASLAALPATSLLDKIGGAAGAAGSVLGAQQGGKNNALLAQGQLNQGQDRNAVDLYQAEQQAQNQAGQADLARQQFTSQDRSKTALQGLIGALIGGGIKPTGSGGGVLASLNGNPDALAVMRTLGSQGSQAQSTPKTFTGGEMVKAPTLTAMPKMDTGGGTLGTITKIAQLLGAVSPYIGDPKKPYVPPYGNGDYGGEAH